jgi:hypothetical protein
MATITFCSWSYGIVSEGTSREIKDNLRFAHDHQCLDPLSVTEMVDNIPAHIGSVQEKTEECMIISHGHCPLDIECMPDIWIRFLFGG